MEVNQFASLTDALKALHEKGYGEDFILDEHGLRGYGRDEIIAPQDVTIMEYHRFEGTSNPDDMSVVYAVTIRDGRKGTLTDAYGTYANPHMERFLKAAKMHEGLQ